MPAEKQYLVTRGVPSLRRATALAYTDEDEDAERLLSFADSGTPSAEGDEWVETHAGRKAYSKAGADHAEIGVIPDIDGPGDGDDVAGRMGTLALDKEPEIIDFDDIPDMEEDDLEDGDEATAAPKTVAPKAVPASEARSVSQRHY